jgi:hypothetical protein
MMTPVDDVRKEMRAYQAIRDEFYNYLDESVPKNKFDIFDFSSNPTLDAKEVYDRFHKLDYQARKVRGLLMEARGIEPK